MVTVAEGSFAGHADRVVGDAETTGQHAGRGRDETADALGMDAFIILRRAAIKHDRMSGEERQRIMDAKIDGGFALAASDDPNKRIEAETPDE